MGIGLLEATVTFIFSAAGMLSAQGRCHTFDRRADGYCRGEGCGAFVLAGSLAMSAHDNNINCGSD